MTAGVDIPSHSRLLRTTFAMIAVLFASTYLVAMARSRVIRSETTALVEDALASVEQVARIGRDLEHERLLVDSHIFEKAPARMSSVEAELADVQADYRSAATEFDRLATAPVERDAWRTLKERVAETKAPIARVLALSRENRDLEARDAMVSLDGQFAQIARELDVLLSANHRSADDTLARVVKLQRSSMILFGGLASIGTLLTVIVGGKTYRLVQRRDLQLRRYSSELEARNRDLDAFAGRVAHDLRTPLTMISLAASQYPSEGAAVSALLSRGVRRMESLIDDLLILSRMDAELGRRIADPATIAGQLREDFAPRFSPEVGALRVEVEPHVVKCAAGLLWQALSNLVDNAIKYRRADVPLEVSITGRAVGDAYQLRISDNGMGMSVDELRHAFEPFYRAHRRRETPGTGLGLAIVKRVVETCGGTISVESQLGRGTTVVLRFWLAHDGEAVVDAS